MNAFLGSILKGTQIERRDGEKQICMEHLLYSRHYTRCSMYKFSSNPQIWLSVVLLPHTTDYEISLSKVHQKACKLENTLALLSLKKKKKGNPDWKMIYSFPHTLIPSFYRNKLTLKQNFMIEATTCKDSWTALN